MLLIPEPALMAWLSAGFWPFLRMTGVFLTAPILGARSIPVLHRVLMSALFAACLGAWGGPWAPIPDGVAAILSAGILQIAFGAGIGLIGRVVVATIGAAGEIAGAAIGSNFARTSGLDLTNEPPVLYNILNMTGMLVYLGAGGMFWTLLAVARSFRTCPSGVPTQIGLHALASFIGVVLGSGTILALPALAAALALNVSIGLANALSPNLNIFSVGFPVLFLGGIWVIGSSIFFIEPAVASLMMEGAHQLAILIREGR
ncbi:MAG: flagellar biosynthetic protein FliR [Paracoccaceae bacterium]|nr:flagellar biosynthetic protein FliR [Paracoccaceae bacterium]